jgi:hypothetical protein
MVYLTGNLFFKEHFMIRSMLYVTYFMTAGNKFGQPAVWKSTGQYSSPL